MLKLKVLKGDKPGSIFKLKVGDNFVGRAPDCDVVLNSQGVSKRHAKISVQNNGNCSVTDLGSSNGTFVNGIKVQDRILRPDDRIAFHDVILELGMMNVMPQQHGVIPYAPGAVAPQSFPSQMPPAPAPAAPAPPQGFLGTLKSYVEKVVLPGVYTLCELYPLKNVMAAFLGAFILMVTALSTIPMSELLKDGIQKESQRRALTIARQLADISERMIASGNEASIRTDYSEAEEGVTAALVVSKEDGHIIAPISKAQTYSNDEFVARARKHDETFIQQISANTIGASVPIRAFNQETGTQVVTAYAQVLYKMSVLDPGSSVSLFARVLIIALLVGSFLFFLLYKTVERPIVEASEQLDKALRGEMDSIETKYDFDVFKTFIENVNSALGRMNPMGPGISSAATVDRTSEASNLVRIVGDAAFSLSPEGVFTQINTAFEDLTATRLLTVQGQGLDILQDQALKLNIEDLVNRARMQPGQVVSNELEISGVLYEIDVQASAEGQGIGYIFGTLKRRNVA